MKVLVTGAAGFIGAAVAARLLANGQSVIGIDNLNAYYDVRLKEGRLAQLAGRPGFEFVRADITDRDALLALFARTAPRWVVHLAAQPGVRFSVEQPLACVDTNLLGFANVLEASRRESVAHFVFASSSSVYGANTRMPFSEHDPTDHPVSLYAATKKANEVMAHSYAHLYQLPCTGLRFFTVYGPWGRPDMALFKFTRLMLEGKPIPVFNRGQMVRDFTYIDDIAEGVVRVLARPAAPADDWSGERPDPATSRAPYRLYNIGCRCPVALSRYIEVLERSLGIEARLDLLPMQAGDVPGTMADVDDLAHDVGFAPATTIEQGVARFVEWYRSYYGTSGSQ